MTLHRINEGTRVTAIMKAEGKRVFSFGSGVFIGNKVPGEDPNIPTPVGFVADIRPDGLLNPCIKLDSGEYVWGCECWWGPEEAVKKRFAGMEFIDMSIDTVREAIRQSNAKPQEDS